MWNISLWMKRSADRIWELLKRAEQAASDRGCKYVFLDTFSFQAPEFYKKMGYKEVFVREEYPVTGKRHYLVKEL